MCSWYVGDGISLHTQSRCEHHLLILIADLCLCWGVVKHSFILLLLHLEKVCIKIKVTLYIYVYVYIYMYIYIYMYVTDVDKYNMWVWCYIGCIDRM